MIDLLLPYIALTLLISSVISGIVAFCHAYRMLTEISPGRSRTANLFPYLVGILPGLLTKRGQEARNRFVFWLFIAVVCGVVSGVMIASHAPAGGQ
ncbi:hypothetical protein [Variovorax paradoxus]|uniref:Uncharacterized protein n=1 Tax=Variovorax paradoxus TaxID=34073 RepID=A0A0H2LSD9_VARPD|nr:hypothetical protein [Variovorax paradoxus]KLN52616.1 hypothetical protein VPARA_62400 [Variovorax paradoxus]